VCCIRCRLRDDRALTATLADRPLSSYVREDAILPRVGAWLAGLISPVMLAANHHDPDRLLSDAGLKEQTAELDRRIANLLSAIEVGGDIAPLLARLERRTSGRAGLVAQLQSKTNRTSWTAAQMAAALEELGGLAELLPAADPRQKVEIYESLGLRLDDDHSLRKVSATATRACGPDMSEGRLEFLRHMLAAQ